MKKNVKFDYVNSTRILSAVEYTENKENYFFQNQVEKILQRVKHIDGRINLSYDDDKTSKTDRPNNTISIIGERGSGKSSLIGTVSNVLKDRKYFVLEPIDPSIFDDALGVLDIFLSHIMDFLKRDESIDEYLSKEIYYIVKSMMQTLSNIRLKEDFEKNSTEIEFLINVDNRVNFNRKMKKLVRKVKKSMRIDDNKSIVIFIDDLDLVKNKPAYQMLENIRNYLSGYVIPIIAYRESQLLDSVVDNRLKNNKDLIDYNIISVDEIVTQAMEYLEKIIPLNNRVYLFDGDSLLKKNVESLLKNMIGFNSINDIGNKLLDPFGIDKSETIEYAILSIIYQKVRLRIQPIHSSDDSRYKFPQNLRGIVQLVDWLYNYLEKIDTSFNDDFNENLSNLIKNIKSYRNYLIRYSAQIISPDQRAVVMEWIDGESKNKNYIIYKKLSNDILKNYKNTDVSNDILDLSYVQSYNITLADIYSIFERYKNYSTENNTINRYFIYIFKILYSMELLMSIVDGHIGYLQKNQNSIEGGASESIDNLEYFNIINGKIFNEELIVFSGFEWKIKYNEKCEEFMKTFAYSDVSTKGDVIKVARKTIGDGSKSGKQEAYKYYSLYDKEKNYTSTLTYSINPFTKIITRDYLNKNIKNYEKRNYLFYSMFDLDILYFINFSRQSEKNELGYVLNKINRLFDVKLRQELRTEREKNNASKLSMNPLFNTIRSIESEQKIFLEEEITKYSEILKPLVKVENKDSDINVLEALRIALNKDHHKKATYKPLIEEILDSSKFNIEEKNKLRKINEHLEEKRTSIRKKDRNALKEFVDKYYEG